MTRHSVNRTLSRLYKLLFFVLFLSLAAKFADEMPGLPPFLVTAAGKFYEFMRDMSLLIATGGVAYISNIFQKRSNFVESLEEEWRNIVRTKSVLLNYCEKPYLSTDDYLAAYSRISETIDKLQRRSGGSSETELNELIVSPIGSPAGSSAVTTVTPVAKLPSVSRKSRQKKPFVARA